MAGELTVEAVKQAAKEASEERADKARAQAEKEEDREKTQEDPPDDKPGKGEEDIPPKSEDEKSSTEDEDEEREEETTEDDDLPSGPTDPDLIALAEDLGLADMVSLFDSDEKLAKAMLLMQRSGRKTEKDGTGEEESEEDPATFDLDLSDEEYDPALVKAIKGMNAHYAEREKATRKELADLKKQLAQRGQADAQAESARIIERFDEAVGKLGSEYEDVLGKGSRDEIMRANPKAYETRLDILEQMDAIAETRVRSGRKPLSFETLFSRSANAVLAGHNRTIADSTKDKERTKRKDQEVERVPGRKVETTVPKKEKAIERVRTIMREKGISPD